MRRSAPVLLIILAILLSACVPLGGNSPDNTVTVSIAYGSEKRAWLEAVTTTFNNQNIETSGGKRIQIDATPLGSNDSLQQILAGTIQPTVWSPASGILIPVANERWGAANSGAELVGDAPPIVLSPVVIAMWEPMARALGWPDQSIGWADLAELTTSGKTWADYGYPEWGTFQFGHTHPDYSNSGITSILAMAYAANNKTRGLTVADVQRPQTGEFIRDVQRSIIHYGESTGFFADQMFTRGPSYLSAAVMYENLVVDSYNRERYPTLGTAVVAIYPREGTFWSDHPYAILNAPWVTDEQREAAVIFRDYLLDRPQQEQALQFGFRPADANVPISAPIVPQNGVDPTQPQTLLDVPSAEVIAAVEQSWVSNKKRVDVIVVLDTSGSMEEEGRLESAKRALSSFIDQLGDDDGIGLTIFGSNATVVSPLEPLGSKRTDLQTRIGGLFARGNTRMVDTVAEAYATLSEMPSGERIRAVVVLSDGADNQSAPDSVDRLLNILRADEDGTSIKVFTIAYGTGSDVNVDLLRMISEASGAKTYQSSPGAIEQIYREIATFF
ncbi:MAG: VWA domain-containing protein [Oscillochloris sp.]|nr:VWA domain-containing protein [Oscillochloris sp.]